MRLPDFIIVGAMKAATSSLASDLARHPSIQMAPRELHYFNSDGNYQKGLDYYGGFFDNVPSEMIAGEKTPSYSNHPLAAGRMAETLPQVKLIWIFREPVSRAYSHYNFFVGRGKEWRTFSQAVNRELRNPEINLIQRYLERGIYVRQVERYLQHFSKSQMLFLLFEDYIHHKQQVLNQTFNFLQVSADHHPMAASLPKNVTYLPRSSFIQWLACRIFRYRANHLYKLISRWNRRPGSGYRSMNQELQDQLTTFFEPYNSQLSKLTGLDLSTWQKMK